MKKLIMDELGTAPAYCGEGDEAEMSNAKKLYENSRFQGDVWYERKMEQRIRQALVMKENDFAKTYSDASRGQLAAYLQECAAELGRPPFPVEIIGSKTILRCFGNWNSALIAAGLPVLRRTSPDLKNTKLWKTERKVQERIWRQERTARKQEKALRRAEKE